MKLINEKATIYIVRFSYGYSAQWTGASLPKDKIVVNFLVFKSECSITRGERRHMHNSKSSAGDRKTPANSLQTPFYYTLMISSFILFLFLLTPPLSFGTDDSQASDILYVGSEACAECHPEEYTNFTRYAKKSQSFKAVETQQKHLTEEEIKKCYSCHTTGYGQPGGFINPELTPHLKNAGCEVCHGPCGTHVKTQDTATVKKHLTKKDCETCHISTRVKAFRYKPLVHGGAH